MWGTNVFFAATNGNLRSVSPTGVVTDPGTGFAPFVDMEFGPDGALYLSDTASDRVLRVAPPKHVLKIERVSPEPVRLLWPTNEPAARLQFTTDLAGDNWTDAPPPVIIGEANVVTSAMSEPQQFYRLLRP